MEKLLPLTAIADAKSYRNEAELYALYDHLRENDPVPLVEHPDYVPFRAVTRFADVRDVESRPKDFIVGTRTVLQTNAMEQSNLKQFGNISGIKTLIHMDGGEHRAYRNITRDFFMPKGLADWQERVRVIAKQFVDQMAEKGGECDFAEEVAFWYPLRIAMTVLGVPPEDETFILTTAQAMMVAPDEAEAGDQNTFAEAVQKFTEYFSAMVEDRRKNPRDDAGSVIANAVIDGEPIGLMETISYFMVIATAGHDTTSTCIAGGMKALLDHPDQLKLAMENPDIMDTTGVNEIVRWVSPVKHFLRTAVADTELGGVPIKANETLMVLFAGANRDEEAFESPNTFDLKRNARSMAFGFGQHACLGQHLARMEITAFFKELLPRIESIELAGEPEYVDSLVVTGLKKLPVKFRMK